MSSSGVAGGLPVVASCASTSRSIQLGRGRGRDPSVAHFFLELGAAAQLRIAVAASAACLLMIDGTARHAVDQVLVAWRHRRAVRIGQTDEIERSVAAAEQAERRLEITVAEDHNLGIVGSDLEDSFDAETAPPLAGASRVGKVFVEDQPVRGLLLEHFIVLVEHPAGSID